MGSASMRIWCLANPHWTNDLYIDNPWDAIEINLAVDNSTGLCRRRRRVVNNSGQLMLLGDRQRLIESRLRYLPAKRD